MVPELQTMQEYINNHFFDELMDELEAAVKLGMVQGLEVDLSKGEPTFLRKDSALVRCNLWREDRTTLLVDFLVRMKIGVPQERKIPKYEVHRFYFSARFRFNDGIQFIPGVHGLSVHQPGERNLPVMSKYLVPVLSYHDMELMVVDMLKKYLGPKAAECFQFDGAKRLLAAIGLKTIHEKLYKNAHTSSMLFFKEGKIRVCLSDDNKQFTEVSIPANTIFLNRSSSSLCAGDDFARCVYHECWHYEWHNMFYELQSLHASDLHLLKYTETEAEKASKPAMKDIRWIERQASFVSLAMMFPSPMFLPEARKHWIAVAGYRNQNMGDKYAYVIRSIAMQYQEPKSYVRARLINLGADGAKGAYNYVDGSYIKPFAFDSDETCRFDTFVISRSEFTDLYAEDENFRNFVQSHSFIYVDGHVCCDCPEFVCRKTTDNKITVSLTDWALAHIDKCCLKFQKHYSYDYQQDYHVGELCFDERYNECYMLVSSLDPANLSEDELMDKNEEYLATLPRYPSKLLTKLIEDRVKTQTALVELSGISKTKISNMCNRDDYNYSIEDVTRIIIGLQMPPPLSSLFLEATGFPRTVMMRHYRYLCLIECCFMDDIDAVISSHQAMFIH